MLSEVASKRLTHEVLSTLMAEVTAIVNNRPLTPVSEDPEAPEILTPFTLLTQKSSALNRHTRTFYLGRPSRCTMAAGAIFGQHFLVALEERISTLVTDKTKVATRSTQFTGRRLGSVEKQGNREEHVAPRTDHEGSRKR